MILLRQLSRQRQLICQQCRRNQHTLARGEKPSVRWADEDRDPAVQHAQWEEQAGKIRSGSQQSMLTILEGRGLVKDVAGGRQTLDWLLTEKRIGAYVGIDPTAPSMHVGHLLPLMTLYWMYLHGYPTFSLIGESTVGIGDPSGRTTARSRQNESAQSVNTDCINSQLGLLWTNVQCLGIKHQFSQYISRKRKILNNQRWLKKLGAVELMRDLGSGMRLGPMLTRDSVKLRLESGEGMAMSEFSYPLFQSYDWWTLYKVRGVQLQIGGSDQYGNICAGMDVISHMRRTNQSGDAIDVFEDPKLASYGLTTPLLTTSSGEKFGKSAGNAVWLDPEMLNSFDLYQYFLKTADDDVERYLKLFTFLSLEDINLVMSQQKIDGSKRIAQHLLAQEIVELAHGAAEAKKAETAHKEAFSNGTATFPLGIIRKALASTKPVEPTDIQRLTQKQQKLLAHRTAYAASSSAHGISPAPAEQSKSDEYNVVILPMSMFQPGAFPRLLYAAGLASSKSEANRLITAKGAYVVLPNSGTIENPTVLKWTTIEHDMEHPNNFLVDWEMLILRAGKSKVQICRMVTDEKFEADGLTCPGWEDIKAKVSEHIE